VGSEPYYVGLDPDVYNFPEGVEEEETGLPIMDEPAFYYDGNVVSETIVKLDPNNPTDKVIFFIKESAHQQNDLAKSNTPLPGTYMAFKEIKLKNKEDESNEEFEIYFSADDPNSTHITGTTTHIFDGGLHLDVAGVERTYLDVNKIDTYTASSGNEIALVKVDNLVTTLRMVAIEADQSNHTYVPGKYNRTEDPNTVVYTSTDFYDMADPTAIVTQNQGYIVNEYNSVNDDRYQHGGIRNISLTTLNARTFNGTTSFNTVGVGLTDMDWKMIRLTY
jgi:hypothetical protein